MSYQPRFTLRQLDSYARAYGLCWDFIFGWRAFTGRHAGECWPPDQVLAQLKLDRIQQWNDSGTDKEFIETILRRRVEDGDFIDASDVKLALRIVAEYNQLSYAVHGGETNKAVEIRTYLIELLDRFFI